MTVLSVEMWEWAVLGFCEFDLRCLWLYLVAMNEELESISEPVRSEWYQSNERSRRSLVFVCCSHKVEVHKLQEGKQAVCHGIIEIGPKGLCERSKGSIGKWTRSNTVGAIHMHFRDGSQLQHQSAQPKRGKKFRSS